MTALRVKHIADALETTFAGLVDMADAAPNGSAQRDKEFKTRALAAQALVRTAGVDAKTAATAVTDGTKDNGIDAVYVDQEDTVVLIQAKWDKNGTAGIGLGEARNFIAGLRDLTDERYDRFNKKFQVHVPDLQAALQNPDVSFVLVVATTGTAEFSEQVSNAFQDMERELNDPSPLVRVESIGVGDFHSAITAGVSGGKIDLDVTIENWGMVSEPYEAYYGTVDSGSVAQWYASYGDVLFEQNIRKPLGNTSVNQAMLRTLNEVQANFWYFNNGITALCGSVQKLAKGASSRTYGEFKLSGVSIVNGAQTVAAIARATREHADAVDARVWVRFISLEGCPPEFASDVTGATNTQNTVERSDFVALDPEQARLRTELLLSLQKTYSIKRGEETPPLEYGCTVTEATVALACAEPEPALAVIAKSAVGRLWESTDRPPYKQLFNARTTANRLWACVEVARAVERALEKKRSGLEGRARAVAVQGNRIALHLVFRELDMDLAEDRGDPWDAELASVSTRTEALLDLMIKQVEAEYPSNYITSLFKNASRCTVLVALVSEEREQQS
jgi:AIPR protein